MAALAANHLVHLIAQNMYHTGTQSLQTFTFIAYKAKFSSREWDTIWFTRAMSMYMIGKKFNRRENVGNEQEAMHAGFDACWLRRMDGQHPRGWRRLLIEEGHYGKKESARQFYRLRKAFGESS